MTIALNNRVLCVGLSLTILAFSGAGAGAAAEKATVAGGLPVEKTMALLRGAEVRFPGSPGNLAVEARIDSLFKASGFQHGEIRFHAPVFKPGAARLIPSGGKPVTMHAMHPSAIRPGNFAHTNFAARVVYAGRGQAEDLKALDGKNLAGAVVLMEFESGREWHSLLRFGVEGFVFIGQTNRYYPSEVTDKVHGTEVRVPRYFVSAADGAELRDGIKRAPGGILDARIEAEPSFWEDAILRDLWVLIPGSDKNLQQEIVAITAPIDCLSLVPELATGAQSAMNLGLLMELFERFSKAPPARSALLVAVNGHTQYFQGERMLAWNLLMPRDRIEGLLDSVLMDIRSQEALSEQYGKLKLDPPTAEEHQFLIAMRSLTDSSTGKIRSVKEPIVNRLKRDINLLKSEQMKLYEASPEDTPERRKKADDIKAGRDNLVNLLTLFNKVGICTTLSDLTPEEVTLLRGYVSSVQDENRRWSVVSRAELEMNAGNTAIRQALDGRLVKFVIALEALWTGRQVGFWSGNWTGIQNWPLSWGQNAAEIAARLEEAGGANYFVDAMTKRGGMPEGHFFGDESMVVQCFQRANRTPAFGLRTAFGDDGQAFSPADTFDALDRDAVTGTFAFAAGLIEALLDDPEITLPSELTPPPTEPIWFVRVGSFKYDKFAASVVPTLPVPGSMVAMQVPMLGDKARVIVNGEVLNRYVGLTDERAMASFIGIIAPESTTLCTEAYHLSPDFVRVDHVIDAGAVETRRSSSLDRRVSNVALALFECDERPIYERYYTANISAGPIMTMGYNLLDGSLNAAPQSFGISAASATLSKKSPISSWGPAAFYFEPGQRIKILASALALKSSELYPEGEGYVSAEEIGPDIFAASARDMSFLVNSRLGKMKGVTDELAKEFVALGTETLALFETARSAFRHLDSLRELYFASGAYRKAYGQITSMLNDMLKALVFYMALMLPFCLFVGKLLFSFKRIEHELALFAALFAITFIVFRLIHPAFRIAQSPEAILIAFIMGSLGLFVISILRGRFEGEMQLLFSNTPVSGLGQAGASMVGQKAMLIGVNNMKRRRIRTSLTTATIVLITFTMLAFTSVSKKMSPTMISSGHEAPYTGLMYHWPGNNRMDEATLRTFQNLFHGRADIHVRRWLLPTLPSIVGKSVVPLRLFADNGSFALADAVLGLPASENGFLQPMPVRSGRFFQSDDAEEVVLTRGMADALGVGPERLGEASIRFNNRTFAVVGILDDDEFIKIKDLNNHPLMPIKSIQEEKQQESSELSSELPDDTGVFYADMPSLLILPVDTARRLGAEPYSVSVRLNPGENLWAAVNDLLTITSASRFFTGSREGFSTDPEGRNKVAAGVYYVGEGYRTKIGGLALLLVPLLISGTIILNTMLGSVFERKKEIAVYNAIGLNPTHIAIFFLAESMVYGVIGAVGGYLIGQLLSMALVKTELVKGLNLNFSSLIVMYVIFFTMAVVLLSTLYPAVVATKVAVPSGKRKWSMPPHDSNRMRVDLPFIYPRALITGTLAYLDDYFGRFTESSLGDLIAGRARTAVDSDEKGRERFRLEYDVALAPFDLGVTQKVIFTAAFDEAVQTYRIAMDAVRVSGQDSNWVTTNKPFLETMRTYLMRWRNLEPVERTEYVKKGGGLFAAGDSAASNQARASS